MKGNIQKLALVMVLATGWALAQQPSQSTSDQTQQAPGQQQPGQTSTQTSTGMSSSDVQTHIQSAIQQDPALANSGITVNVTDDKVQLSGTATSNAEKDKARDIAEASAGGRKVVNKIKVSSKQTAAPSSNPPK